MEVHWGVEEGTVFPTLIITPEIPSTQYLRFLVPKARPRMVFGTGVLKYRVLGPSGYINTDSAGARRLHHDANKVQGP